MRQIFAFEKDKNKLTLLLFHIKDKEVFINDYQQKEITGSDSASDIIKQFLSSNKATAFKTICLLSLSSIYLRKLAFPYRRISKIKNSIKFAIEPHIPIPVENTKVFFQPVSARNNGQSRFFPTGGIEVISFVVPELLLNEQLELISSSGLVCNEIYLVPLSIFNLLISRSKINQNALLLHIGEDTTYIFSVLKGGKLADLRQIPMGKDEVEKEKNELKREISTLLLSQASQIPENKISEIYVSGLPAKEKRASKLGISDWLAENFNVPVKEVKLGDLLSIKQSADDSEKAKTENGGEETLTSKPLAQNFIPEILYASLGIIGTVLNFYPSVLQEKEKKGIRISISIALFALLAISFRLQFERSIYERKINILNSRIEGIFNETFPDASDKRTPLLQMRAAVKNLKDNSPLTNAVSLSPLEALREISQDLAKEVEIELDSFRAREDEITISGSALSYGDIDKIKAVLESSPLFSKVDIESAQTAAQGVTFRLKIIPASTNK